MATENALLAPTESQRVIQRDAVTRLFSFDLNTAMAVPGPPALGFIDPKLLGTVDNEVTGKSGNATGKVWIDFLQSPQVQDDKKYEITFEDIVLDSVTTEVGYTLVDLPGKGSPFRLT